MSITPTPCVAGAHLARLVAGLVPLLASAVMSTPGQAAVVADGYGFTNFDFPDSGTNAGAGTNVNGIANSGAVVGFSIANNGAFINYVRSPDGTVTQLMSFTSTTAMALGINSAGDVVGSQNGDAVFLAPGQALQTLASPSGATSTTAFGVNDKGWIVGQLTTPAGDMPGFVLQSHNSSTFTTVNASSGPDTVNAQGINDHGLVVGFYIGLDGQDHGFDAKISSFGGVVTGTAIADPTIPNVPGEPGATFVFSQILGVNDQGIAVGYYGDSTTSQHGFLYNTKTGVYTFLDDPSEQFNNGVEVTQITGINNFDEITGFYSDANGVFHGFTACPTGLTCAASLAVPEPGTWTLMSLGFVALGFGSFRGSRRAARGTRNCLAET